MGAANRHVSNGEQVHRLATRRRPSVDFSGYWAAAPARPELISLLSYWNCSILSFIPRKRATDFSFQGNARSLGYGHAVGLTWPTGIAAAARLRVPASKILAACLIWRNATVSSLGQNFLN